MNTLDLSDNYNHKSMVDLELARLRMNQYFSEQWAVNMENTPKLRTYKLFKHEFATENYGTNERIQSADLQSYLDENTTLPGFPDHRMLNARTQFTERLQEDYRRVSIASIFVEQMRIDEEHSSYSPSYTVDFRHIESQIYTLLCQLKMAVIVKGQQLPYVSYDVMNNALRNTDTHAQRHMRDYRILRDIVGLFHAIQRDYESILSGEINLHVDNR